MPTRSNQPVQISEKAAEHMAYLLQGDDPALPDDCGLCAELRSAGIVQRRNRPNSRAKWWVQTVGQPWWTWLDEHGGDAEKARAAMIAEALRS